MEGRGEEFSRKPFLIGVAGGTASGKSSVCKKIVDELRLKGSDVEGQRVYVLSLESFYRTLSEDEIALAEKGQFDFDHPRAFDYEMLKKTMLEIISKRAVEIFEYDHTLHKRDFTKSRKIVSADVVFIEGILVFYQEDIRSLFNMKLFVDTDADTRLARRVERDIEVLGRPLENILHQYITYVKPAFEEFCLPTKKYADVIIPRGADNTVAVDLIVQHIKDLLKGRGMRVKQSPRVRTVDPLQIYLSTDPTGSDPVLHSPSPGSSIKRYLSEDQYSEYH